MSNTISNSSNNTKSSSANNIVTPLLVHHQKANVLLSPYSLLSALSALHYASNNNTEKLLTNFLGDSKENIFGEVKSINKYLSHSKNALVSNNIFVRDDMKIKENYAKQIQEVFGLNHFNSNNLNQTLQAVNKLVYDNTNGKIEKILEAGDIDSDTIMIILNTLYFKGNWAIRFKKNLTAKKIFNNDSKRNIDMMTSREKYFRYTANQDCQAVELNYEGNKFCMGIVLPTNGKNLITDNKVISELSSKMRSREITTLQIPKFKAEATINFEEFLCVNGLSELFNHADITNMMDMPKATTDKIKVMKVIQKTFIEVDEDGTEAAAATGITMHFECYTPPLNVIADRPFTYYIKHNSTNTILFAGFFQ